MGNAPVVSNETASPFASEMDEVYENVLSWLGENIGPLIKQNGMFNEVFYEGTGWKIIHRTDKRTLDSSKPDSNIKVIGWYLQIEDEQKATMFALKWIK